MLFNNLFAALLRGDLEKAGTILPLTQMDFVSWGHITHPPQGPCLTTFAIAWLC